MKPNKKYKLSIVILMIFIHMIVFAVLGIFIKGQSESRSEASEETYFESRSRLQIEALRHIGACTPEGASAVWGKGLKKQNAAMQFSVMTDRLGNEYIENLEVTAPNWVVGLPSPWVGDYKINKTAKTTDDNKVMIVMDIFTAKTEGMVDEYKAILTVVKEDDGYWRIAKISMDEGLYVYTGFYNPYNKT